VTGQLPWPDALLAAADWPAVRLLVARCLDLERRGALPGTLMLVGKAGAGREAAAVELAAALVCRSGAGVGCACASCQRVRRGVHPDVETVDVLPEKKLIVIEQAREVVEHLAQHPYEGRRRVFILTSCHTPPLGADAASALLKTLEEPPGHVTFILLASNPARVLPTIVSRAVQVRIPPPTDEQAIGMLERIHGCDRQRATAILDAAGGDASLALEAGEEAPIGEIIDARQALAAATAGDAIAILRVANAFASSSVGVGLAVSSILRLAAGAPAEQAEALLAAARTLLIADGRHATLNLDLEGLIVGGLADLTSSSRSR
jgi:DNA polymerase III delta prime subunit